MILSTNMLHLPQIKYLGALWGMMEPYVSAYIRAKGDDADGMRAQQDLITIKKLLREKLHHETLHHYIKFLQSKLGLEALEVPQEGRGKRCRRCSTAFARRNVRATQRTGA